LTKELLNWQKIKNASDWTAHLVDDVNQDLYRFQIYCWGKLGYIPQENPIW
jgi:hypothetical protein